MIARRISLLIFLLILFAFSASAQTSPKAGENKPGEEKEIVLEFKTQLVVVPFSVADRTNRPVADIKPEDLKLYENGQPAQLLSLQRSDSQPLSFALLLDLSGSMQPRLPAAREAASRFFERALKPEKDRAAVLAFQQEIVVAQPLTKDRSALARALELKNIVLTAENVTGPVIDGDTHRISATALYGAIYIAVDEVLQNAEGHRVIVLITDGYDSESGIELRDALDYAWRREVTIYTIGLGDPESLNHEVLERLCSATGGRAFYPKTAAELDSVFAQIDEDLRTQYVLSFYPNAQADDTFRTIKIDIPARPSLSVRHRFGYYNAVVDEAK